MELESWRDFKKVANKVDIVIRRDPFLLVNYYGIFMYIDMRKISREDLKFLLQDLKGKIVNVRRHVKANSIMGLMKNENEL